METLVGITMGGYTLTRILGSGGMGTVYLAEDKAVGQQVAIKVVRTDDDEAYTEMISKEQAAERFRQEARAVASLDHLHILPLYRYGEEATTQGVRAYMVMQYRPEGSLLDWQKQRAGKILAETSSPTISHVSSQLPPGLPESWPLCIEEAADYLRQAACALQYAHDRGIIHRDVKPANFLLRFDTNQATGSPSAFLLLSDFGLAKFFSSSSAATTSILGTPTYMAPEQFDGTAGPESDQYALAIMIYYLLAGRPPFIGDPIYLLNQHLHAEPPPIRTFSPTLSAGVEASLTHALAKKPSERYPSITAFAEDFILHMYTTQHALLHNTLIPPQYFSQSAQTGAAREISGQPSTQQPAAIPSSMTGNKTPAPFSQADYAVPTLLQNASSPTPSSPPFMSPTSPLPSQQSYTLQNQMLLAPTSVATHSATVPAEPRTNRRGALGWIVGGITVLGLGIATGIETHFYTNPPLSHQQPPPNNSSASANTGQQQHIPQDIKSTLSGHSGAITSLSWSSDGSQLASASLDASVRLWDLATQQNTTIYAGHSQGVLTVAWNQASNLLASGGEDTTIQIWNTSGKTRDKFTKQAGAVSKVLWAQNDGRLIISIRDHGLYEIVLSSNTVKPVGKLVGNYSLALSPNGRYLAVGTENGYVTVFDIASPNTALIEKHLHLGLVRSLAWSPNSLLLASGGKDRMVRVMDITTKTIGYRLPLAGVVNDLSWEPGNTGRLAIAVSTGTVVVWHTTTDERTLHPGHQGSVTAVVWGQQALASGSVDKSIIIWTV